MNVIASRRGSYADLIAHMHSDEFLDGVRTGIMLFDANGAAFDCNHAATTMLGLTFDQLRDHTSFNMPLGAVRDDGSSLPGNEYASAIVLRTGEPCYNMLMGVNNPGRPRRWLWVDGYPLTVDGRVQGAAVWFDDVSVLRQQRHSLKLLTAVNQFVMSTTNELDPLQHLCDALVEYGPYALAWIGRPSDNEPGAMDIAFVAGATDYPYEGMVSWSGQKKSGLGPIGTALRTGRTQVVDDLTKDSLFEPWRERAAEFGLNSVVAIPFTPDGRRAVLAVYDSHIHAFDDVTVKGLEDIAGEIEFAVAHVRSLQQTKKALKETTAAIAALKKSDDALAESEERFRLAFEDNMAPMIFSDLNDLCVAVNDTFCEMVGFTREELLGHDSIRFTMPEDVGITEASHTRLVAGDTDQARYVKRYLRKDGRVIVAEVSRSTARDAEGSILYLFSSERDITEERALADQLSHRALHDPLTGLANRALFEDRLSQAHARIIRQGGFGAVLMVDLDDFKGVNDAYGHLVGDQLLVGVARRFELVTRSSDTLCRLGGDEFLYLAEGLASADEAEEVAGRLLEVLVEPFSFSGIRLKQHASIGVVVWDGTTTHYGNCVQEADVALYEAKRLRKGRHLLFCKSMQDQAISRFSLVQELRQALESGHLSMHYQPIVDLTTTEVVGFEALMRWQHPGRGWVPPNVFIPLAEQNELILELGAFAIREAVAAARSWEPLDAEVAWPYVTINLSAHQFHSPGLIPMIEDALSACGLPPECLIVEITESVALLDAAETANTISHLKRLGIRLALDDFGTGYSSLSYLAQLLPTIIKIDRSFVSPEQESAHSSALLEAIVSLGHKLHTTVLAEGIETQEQLERLGRLGCELGQGFLWSAAVPIEEAIAMLNSGERGLARLRT
jgi:diguanylate cyclase (GGDEF)-like protein/PAS domain S-box-containing protein